VNILSVLSRKSQGNAILKYADEALELSNRLQCKKGIAYSHAYLGKYYYFSENFSTSLLHCRQALEMATGLQDHSLSAYVCKYIGYNHFLNEPKISLEYYHKSIVYSILAGDKSQEAYAYSAIGNLYESWYDGKTALGYYLMSLKIRESIKSEPDELASSLIETARAYGRIERFDKKKVLVERALRIAENEGKDFQNLVYIYQLVGYDYADRLHNYEKALQYFLKSYELVKTNKAFDKNNIPCIKPVADMYLQLKDYKKSSEYFKEYFDLTEANQRKLNKDLYESEYLLQKETEKKKFLEKDAEILKQKVEIQKQENLRNLFIAGTLILLALAFFIYMSYRFKQRSNVLLENKVRERTAELAIINEQLQNEINEKKRAAEKLILSELQLRDANKELEAFIYKASHDLKGPLSSSRGLVNLAVRTKNEEERQQFLELIVTSLDKLDNILMGLHEIAIIRQGTLVLKKADVNAMVHSLINNFKGYANYDKIKFTVDNRLKRDFYTDEILLQSILRNLIENAIKYTRQDINDPFVKIVLDEESDDNVIFIKDNGIGISPEHHEKIFDVFYRATNMAKGSGLGLYIVKNAINKLGGQIEILGSTDLTGSHFKLSFPSKTRA